MRKLRSAASKLRALYAASPCTDDGAASFVAAAPLPALTGAKSSSLSLAAGAAAAALPFFVAGAALTGTALTGGGATGTSFGATGATGAGSLTGGVDGCSNGVVTTVFAG